MSTDAAELFRAHRSRLFAIAYRMLGSVSEAEDAVQEAFATSASIPKGSHHRRRS